MTTSDSTNADNSAADAALTYKDKGNEAFKLGQWQEALKLYTQAIKASDKHKELPVFYKNRAAAHLKLASYQAALDDCTESLRLTPKDPKALFRRAQALEALEKFEEAYRDATELFKEDPANKSVQPMLQRLHLVVQERAAKNAKTITKVRIGMFALRKACPISNASVTYL